MRKKVQAFEEIKKKYVRMALETNKIVTTAKTAGVHRSTLTAWINEYGDEIREEMEMEAESGEVLPLEKSGDYYKQQYERAMRLLGEKELEIAVLKDLVKKRPF
ncbi:hypothetical protein [Jeotgalibacillus aurantiacus]|uniref:hypothetical protein n=1 Tax=Jeotgalibacillus aurantiacus TaxID=2763266 RepID=UPI001D09F5A9|nr:hypothetical protein [Jeotgalibacillus aurantiacus]